MLRVRVGKSLLLVMHLFVVIYLWHIVLYTHFLRGRDISLKSLVFTNITKPQYGKCVSSRFCGLHRGFFAECGVGNAEYVAKYTGKFPLSPPIELFPAKHARTYDTLSDLAAVQSCQYAGLNEWWNLSRGLNVTRWSLLSGSIIGSVCYDGLIPWDDDIDIAVHDGDCVILEALWKTLKVETHLYEHLGFEGRKLSPTVDFLKANGWFLGFRRGWFKLMVRKGLLVNVSTGMDINCVFSEQWASFDQMRFRDVYEDVIFGPTTARRVKPVLLDQWPQWRWMHWFSYLNLKMFSRERDTNIIACL